MLAVPRVGAGSTTELGLRSHGLSGRSPSSRMATTLRSVVLGIVNKCSERPADIRPKY